MTLTAGAAQTDLTPHEPMFLFGYPHVPRTSTGVHDPLYASALCMDDGTQSVMLIAVDVLMLAPDVIRRCRDGITTTTGIPADHILISTTHTHSAPVTCNVLAFRDDPVVPPADPAYLDRVCAGIVDAATHASRNRRPAHIAVTRGLAQGVGSNRHDPAGPSDPEVGVLAVRDADTKALLALDLVYSMHPTVLHEDTTLVSADFPGFTRAYLAARFPGAVIVYHTGPSGNQSPRYTVTGQTFAEAKRLGESLGQTVFDAVAALRDEDYAKDATVAAAATRIALPCPSRLGPPSLLGPGPFPPVAEAEALHREALATYERLRQEGAPHGPRRTAEVAVFGAEERVTLARAQARGEVADLLARYAEAEVQVIRVANAALVGLPGELFVEYGLAIKARASAQHTTAFVISLANGELQGYITTPGAAGYEASLSLFPPESGALLVAAALDLIELVGLFA